VFHALAYADVFDYPLTAPEVYRYLPSATATLEQVSLSLEQESVFSRVGEYFTLRGREEIVDVRKRRAVVARRLWSKAGRYTRLIATLPFVRMVAVTGSLAMNNTEQGKDVDLMIVTAPHHLWTCRALTLLVARLARLEGVTLCPNYLVTTEALELNERSLYVAHELAQMVPLSGMKVYAEMMHRNAWIVDYLPNGSVETDLTQALEQSRQPGRLQKILEILFGLPFVAWFERWEMDRKIKRLRREQSSSLESYFSEEVCKGHIDRHGENVATALAIRLADSRSPLISARHQPKRRMPLDEVLPRLDHSH
jgi:hypothetical protein